MSNYWLDLIEREKAIKKLKEEKSLEDVSKNLRNRPKTDMARKMTEYLKLLRKRKLI